MAVSKSCSSSAANRVPRSYCDLLRRCSSRKCCPAFGVKRPGCLMSDASHHHQYAVTTYQHARRSRNCASFSTDYREGGTPLPGRTARAMVHWMYGKAAPVRDVGSGKAVRTCLAHLRPVVGSLQHHRAVAEFLDQTILALDGYSIVRIPPRCRKFEGNLLA